MTQAGVQVSEQLGSLLCPGQLLWAPNALFQLLLSHLQAALLQHSTNLLQAALASQHPAQLL
jgi:hypothetical protein